MQLWGSLDCLVHLEYSASYLISSGDSGKPTETNLDVHNYTLQKAQQLLRKMWIGNPLEVIGNKVWGDW